MANRYQTYVVSDDFSEFLDICSKHNLLSLNYESSEIRHRLEEWWLINKGVHSASPSKLRSTLSKHLGLFKAATPRQSEFYILRGYSKEFAEETIANRQSCLGKRNNANGQLDGRYTKTWFKERYLNDWNQRYTEKHNMTSPSLENYIRRHGETGHELYLQRNKGCGVTLKRLIARYGQDIGTEKWSEYTQRQRYTNSIEYFIEKFGEPNGRQRWFQSYGNLARQSAKANEFFKRLISELSDTSGIYCFDNEWVVWLDQNERDLTGQLAIQVDFKQGGKIIEFYGNYYHANPAMYDSSKVYNMKGVQVKARDIWQRDANRNQVLANRGFELLVIWESDYDSQSDETIKKASNFIQA